MRSYLRKREKSVGDQMLFREGEERESAYVSAPLLTVGEAARYLGVSRKTLYRIIEEGELTALKAGGATVVEKKSLDEFREAGMLT